MGYVIILANAMRIGARGLVKNVCFLPRNFLVVNGSVLKLAWIYMDIHLYTQEKSCIDTFTSFLYVMSEVKEAELFDQPSYIYIVIDARWHWISFTFLKCQCKNCVHLNNNTNDVTIDLSLMDLKAISKIGMEGQSVIVL